MNTTTPTSASILFYARSGTSLNAGALKRNIDASAQRDVITRNVKETQKLEDIQASVKSSSASDSKGSSKSEGPQVINRAESPERTLGGKVDVFV